MKLALVGPLPPLRGGISHYNASLLNALRELGAEVRPYSFEKLYPDRLFPGTKQFDENLAADQLPQGGLLAWRPERWLSVLREWKRWKPNRIVYHHWHPFFVPVYTSLMRYRAPEGHVIIAHNVIPHEHQRVGAYLNRLLFRKSRFIVVGAKVEQDRLRDLVPAAQSVIRPHPVYDRFRSSLSHSEAKAKTGYPPDRPLFVHAGLVRAYKGVDLLLEAFHRIRTEESPLLYVTGEFYDDFTSYQHLAQTGAASDRIKLKNQYLDDHEMSDILRAADAVVLPYRHATQSGIAMAALANGTPVIASAVGALRDLVTEGHNGILVQPGSTTALREGLETFLASQYPLPGEKRETIAHETDEQYSWNALAQTILEDQPI